MAIAQTQVVITLNPFDPVAELNQTISAVLAFHPGNERDVLLNLQASIERVLDSLEKKQGVHENQIPEVQNDSN